MSSFYTITAISSEERRLKEFGNDQEVEIYFIDFTRRITPLKDLRSLIKLFRYLNKEKPNIVHTHTPKAGIVGMLASYLVGVPNRLHTVAGLPLLEARGIKKKILILVERITYACATKVYPNSFGLKKIIIDNGFTKRAKIRVIAYGSSNGIDTAYFNPDLFTVEQKVSFKVELGIKTEDFVFIFIGRIVRDKGIDELVVAFEKLSKEREKVTLLLVGPCEEELDPLKKRTKAIINENKRIISVGFKRDVRPYLAISDVLVLPSYREGFPNVVLQAGAMNLPSIVTNINGCNEIIEENKNGLIIPVKNAVVLFESMLKIMSNTHMKLNTRKMIKDRFEQRLVWDAMLKEYKSFDQNV